MAELLMSAAQIAVNPARWLELRRQGITATDAATIMGVNPYDSPFALWHRKAGNLPEVPDNDRFRLARYLEGYCRERWCDRVGFDQSEVWVPGGLYRKGWQLATPDYLILGRADPKSQVLARAVLECKTVGSWDGWSPDTIPQHVRVQVLWQCAVLGVPVGHVAALHRQSGQFRSYLIEPQADDLWQITVGRCLDFWESLQVRTPPPVDGAEATTAALRALHPGADPGRTVFLDTALINMWEEFREYAAAHTANLEMAKNLVREAMGDAKYARYIDEEGREWRIAQRIQSKVQGYWVAPHERDELRYGRKKAND